MERDPTPSEALSTPPMPNATKRIPVTEERWNELHDLKEPGQTYDELLADLIAEHRRHQLASRAREIREAEAAELTSLDEL